jgi:hypothetical protein
MKPAFNKIPIAVAVSWILLACTTVQVNVKEVDRADKSARVLRTRLDFVDQTYQAIPYSIVEQKSGDRGVYKHVSFPDPIEISLYAVSGRLAGGEADRFFRIRLKRAFASLESGTQQDFAISLATVEAMISSRAALYVPKPEDSDFRVEPADTRVARLILTAGDPGYYPYFERESGFIDRNTGSHFALLYVDRPCRIAGVIKANDGTFRHDLHFARAGLHWIQLQGTAEKTTFVTPRDPSGSVVVYARLAP